VLILAARHRNTADVVVVAPRTHASAINRFIARLQEWCVTMLRLGISCVLALLLVPMRTAAQTPTFAWDEDPASTVTGFAVTVDGVRTDYGKTPLGAGGACGCVIPLPFASGKHTLVVIAYNSTGEKASAPYVNGPTANAGGPYSAQVGSPLTVNAAASTDVGGAITSYSWNWGDGSTVTQISSSSGTHTYAAAGTFTISLTVTDTFLVTSTATATVTVTAAGPGTPTSPSPANGATGISTTPTLTWNAAGASSYDVQFGTANPPPTAASNLTSPSYRPATLTAGTRYFWRVIARSGGSTSTGAVWSFTTASATPTAGDVVVYADDVPAGNIHGAWRKTADASAAAGTRLETPDAGLAVTSAPLAAPANYVDVSFNAAAGTPYALWVRMAATANSKYNDSLWAQFSDALSGGAPVYPLNSPSGLLLNLATDSTGSSVSGWGWQNRAYWLAQPATFTFATSGAHTLRIQVREDGAAFDQIVLSPSTFLTQSPGGPTGDTTIVPRSGAPGTPMPTTPADGATGVSTTPTLTWSAANATSYDVQFGAANPPPVVSTGQTTASYITAALSGGTTYFWRIVARNAAGATIGPIWSFTASGSSNPPPSPSGTNLALNRPMLASSLEAPQYAASNAADGSLSTRWSSEFSDPQWILVDLGQTVNVGEVILRWETAFGADYQLLISNDGNNWTTLRNVSNGNGGVDDLSGLSGSGRYVGVYGTRRGTQWGYSLLEMEVYGTPQ
jgi:hypothetical protein